MDERARELCNLLLREGSLRRDDDEHRSVYAELMSDPLLFADVGRRLDAVGYELVQALGHLGVRIARGAEASLPLRNHMGLDAADIRLIVYLWVRLVYQEWVNLRRDLQVVPGDAAQTHLFGEAQPDAPYLSYRAVFDDFARSMRESHLKGVLGRLQRERFVAIDKRLDRIVADASLYVLVDRVRMEDYVVGLARRLGGDPVAAVAAIATGSAVSEPSDAEGQP